MACVALAVAGCDRKPASEAAKNEAAAKSEAMGKPPAGPIETASGCPSSTPDNAVIGTAIGAAMVQIYGGEEAPAHYRVTAATATDCRNLAITYTRAGGQPQKSTVAYMADDKWYLMLFGKPYLVQ